MKSRREAIAELIEKQNKQFEELMKEFTNQALALHEANCSDRENPHCELKFMNEYFAMTKENAINRMRGHNVDVLIMDYRDL